MRPRVAVLALPALLLAAVPFARTARTSDRPAAAPPDVVAVDPSRIAPAYFPHDEHVDDFEIACDECHHETDAAPLSVPHEEYFADFWIDCAICHHGPGAAALEPQKCSKCHHAKDGDIADQTLSAKVVVHQSCWSCHEVGTGAEASASCADCHTGTS